MRILSLDSSSEAATVSILDEGRVLGEINFNYKKQHSVLIMNMIDDLLKASNLDINEIEGYVVSKGPGSFTGLRIGMATIKGLSFGSKKPIISISSLDALAHNLYGAEGIICPIMDALRGNVYTSMYSYEKGNLVKLRDYMLLSVEELCERLKEFDKKVYFIGDATEMYKDTLKASLEECDFAPSHLNYIRASSLGNLGLKLLNEGIQDELNTIAPFYLRKSQAEREYDKKMGIIDNE